MPSHPSSLLDIAPNHLERFFATARAVRDNSPLCVEELLKTTILYQTRSILLPDPEVTAIADEFPGDHLRVALACLASTSSKHASICFQRARQIQTLNADCQPFPRHFVNQLTTLMRDGQPTLRQLRSSFPVKWTGFRGVRGASQFICQWAMQNPYGYPAGDAEFACATYTEERYGLSWLVGDHTGKWTKPGYGAAVAAVVEEVLHLQHDAPYRQYHDDGFVWSAYHVTAFAAAFGHHSFRLLIHAHN